MRAFVAAIAAAFLSTSAGRAAEAPLSEAEFLAPLQDDHPAVRALLGDLGEAQGEEISAHAFRRPSSASIAKHRPAVRASSM